MNGKTLSSIGLSVLLSLGALTANAQSSVTPVTYTYDTQLDIAKVLSISEEATQLCAVVNSRMTYLDSQGREHALDYLKLSSACSNGG
ncbi:DUF2790 domain-containing protein [Pseudomonas sp. SH1-B]